jgi:uncharacterized protein (AIM24 family)
MAFGPFDRDENDVIAEVPPWPSGNEQPSSDQPSSDGVDTGQEDFLFHLYRGSELLKDNQMLEAKEELEQALTLQPRDLKGQDLLAVVYFRLGLYPRAIHLYEQLRRLNPKDPALKLNLALCYLKTGQTPLAKVELEQLVEAHPNHTRAWGYLGLAHERLADYVKAEQAYGISGHADRARRMAEKLGRAAAPRIEEREVPSREVREAASTAAAGLDQGQLSFAIAAPASDATLASGGEWKPVELGQAADPPPQSARSQAMPVIGPGPDLSGPRRPTLVVAPPPAHLIDPGPGDLSGLPSVGSPSMPLFEDAVPPAYDPPEVPPFEDAPPERERAVTAPPPGSAHPPPRIESSRPRVHDAFSEPTQVLRHPPPRRDSSIGTGERAPISIRVAAERGRLDFPEPGTVAMHSPTVALGRMRPESKADGRMGFAVRLEAVRAMSGGIATSLLERHARGKSIGESFGGIGSPVVELRGDGDVVIGARASCVLANFALAEESCFLREDVVVLFDRLLEYDNGKLATGEGEYVSVVQFKGTGPLLAEVKGTLLTIDVTSGKSVNVRREGIIGWFGRLVPRALAPSEAPSGQRGLVTFAGDGTVLLSA